MIKLMERFPIIIMLGAALIGWVGGETIVSDVASRRRWRPTPGCTSRRCGRRFFVVAVGRWQQRRAAPPRTDAAAPDQTDSWRTWAHPSSPDTGSLTWDFAALTDPGRVRANNEDTIAFDDASLGLVLLADGMGGYNGGEVASGMAIALLQASFGRWLAARRAGDQHAAVRRALQAGIDEANAAILEAGLRTCSCRAWAPRWCWPPSASAALLVGHIGDSRCYRLRDDKLEQLTRDHSLLQEQLDAGAITPEQAASSPHRNLVTRALGIEATSSSKCTSTT